jgi:TolB-like protein/DNA-binding winged helix-turn-helix (wHTH) protein
LLDATGAWDPWNRKLLFIFEDYSLDGDRRELRRGLSLLPVEPQVFDLLLFLINNRDRVVSRDDLLGSVWGGRIVSESTLASRINAARRAVGDTGEQQRLIRTVLRKGFRFVGVVREAEKSAASVDCAAAAPSPRADFGLPDRPCDLATEALPRSRRGRRASVAVMPFQAISQTDDCFADGLSHDIISGLARLRTLFVIARGSTFALRDRASNPREIGRVLDVDYAATGSVLRTGDRLLVSVELCATGDGRLVWADTYETPVPHAFEVSGHVGAKIIGSLNSEIETTERNRAMLRPPNSLNAWEAHHRGLWHMYRFTGPDNEQAQRYFERAIKLDPTFSRAYAGLSFTHWQNAFQFKPADRQKEADRAFDAAGSGLLADRRDPAAHWAMGRALWLRGQDAASVRELNEAVALSPNFAIGHYTLGFVQAQTGDAGVAIEAVAEACNLSPFDPMTYAMCAALACALFRLERYEEAADWALKVAQQPNAHAHARAMSALVLAGAGRLEESFREMSVVHNLRPGFSIDDFFSSFRLLGDQERTFRSVAKQIGMG